MARPRGPSLDNGIPQPTHGPPRFQRTQRISEKTCNSRRIRLYSRSQRDRLNQISRFVVLTMTPISSHPWIRCAIAALAGLLVMGWCALSPAGVMRRLRHIGTWPIGAARNVATAGVRCEHPALGSRRVAANAQYRVCRRIWRGPGRASNAPWRPVTRRVRGRGARAAMYRCRCPQVRSNTCRITGLAGAQPRPTTLASKSACTFFRINRTASTTLFPIFHPPRPI